MSDEDIYSGYNNKNKDSFAGAPGEAIADDGAADEAARQKALGKSKGEFGDFADEEDESSNSCCVCFAEHEEEVEWRSVALRFGTNISPVAEQRGSVDNAVFTGFFTFIKYLCVYMLIKLNPFIFII
jgi:hypothetical protein